jgi:hypothetical protein
MHSLYDRKDPIPSLYVKSVYGTYQVRQIFEVARNMSPCMLIMEDMETIVYGGSRSYFFNEVDGLENNNGILMIGTTNYLERLDPGITKRPSRFDRKYLFPLPTSEERVQYCEYWRKKIAKNPAVDYPKKLVNLIAAISFGFSFAYLQEAFVATLLELARQQVTGDLAVLDYISIDEDFGKEINNAGKGDDADGDDDDDDDDDLEKLPFWRVIRKQIEILRDDLNGRNTMAQEDAEESSMAKKVWDTVIGGMSQYLFGANANLPASHETFQSSKEEHILHHNDSDVFPRLQRPVVEDVKTPANLSHPKDITRLPTRPPFLYGLSATPPSFN